MHRIQFLTLLALVVAHAVSAAEPLPGFPEFRRIDRTRRLTGQFQSAELLAVMRVEPALITRTAQAHPNDATILWGAAELLPDWPAQRTMFEAALRVGGTNAVLALRLACAAARQRDWGLTQTWLGYCATNDTENLAPWIVEAWVLRERKAPLTQARPPSVLATKFRDYSVAAAHARIQLLEAAGYSAYAARRLGFNPDSMLLRMARDFSLPPYDDEATVNLRTCALAMQQAPPFLLTELVGQTLEAALLAARPDAATSPEVRKRNVELSERRQDLKDLLARVEENSVDLATEAEMVQYFDRVLSDGEEAAMKWLADAVQQQPAKPR